MGARQDVRITGRPGRNRGGSTSTHSPASSPQAQFRRYCRIPCTKLLAHLLLLLHVLVADRVLRGGVASPRSTFHCVDAHCAEVFDVPLHCTLLHLRALPTSTCASASLAAGVCATRRRPFPARPSGPSPTSHFAVRRNSAPTGIMYFLAEKSAGERGTEGGVCVGAEDDPERIATRPSPPPCARGWDDAIARHPARGESLPGQLLHPSLYKCSLEEAPSSPACGPATQTAPILRQSLGEYATLAASARVRTLHSPRSPPMRPAHRERDPPH
ncbi:hypothetical protein K438DRAFT_1982037 [Mycena galopus ATCC 62051]|nr:hypothetical protein K438DRAFT_1982037 [Mycena galopus ATCC 62051]